MNVMPEISVTLLLDNQHMGPPVELTDGSKFPRSVQAWATVDDTPMTLELVVENGRPVLTTLSIARRSGAKGALKASTVHEVPVDQVVRQTVEQVGRLMARLERFSDIPWGGDLPPEAWDQMPDALRSYGRRVVDDELLRQVATVVLSDPLGMPNQAVKQQLHTSARNASRWITAARKRGFIPANDKGAQQ
jgi:hypothetical protein